MQAACQNKNNQIVHCYQYHQIIIINPCKYHLIFSMTQDRVPENLASHTQAQMLDLFSAWSKIHLSLTSSNALQKSKLMPSFEPGSYEKEDICWG